jgi:TRAP transporter TAXI family solute receptor
MCLGRPEAPRLDAAIRYLCVAALAQLLACGAAQAQVYGLGTGKQGFFTYSAGAAIAKIASENGLRLRIQPFGGTSAYVPAVNAGEIEFGLANELETTYAVTGKVIYEGKPQPDVRAVSILTPLYSVFFVRKDSDIKSIADLKGKRVPTDYVSQRVLDELTRGAPTNSPRARRMCSCLPSAPARWPRWTPRSAGFESCRSI